jgi:hypothetical protein
MSARCFPVDVTFRKRTRTVRSRKKTDFEIPKKRTPSPQAIVGWKSEILLKVFNGKDHLRTVQATVFE